MLNKKSQKTNKSSGFGLLEVIVGATIISLSFAGLMSVSAISLRVSRENLNSAKASFVLEEGVEALKAMRDRGWSANIDILSAGTDYYLHFDGANWVATTTLEYVDGFFERKFAVNDVYRDANDDIADSGSFDKDTKKITISVSWFEGNIFVLKEVSTYITNIFE